MIYKVAGALGLDPRPYSLRELFWLFEGRDRQQWMHTAAINATLSASSGAKNVRIENFHPYMQDSKLKNLKKRALELKARKEKQNGENNCKD